MKRIWILLLCLALAMPCDASPSTSAASAILVDADTGAVLYEQNADQRSLIASTTKIMTALTVLDSCPTETEFVIPPEAVGIEGSSVYLRAGEVWTVEGLLYGLMLCSGNDAAVALALCCDGSVEAFVAHMNEKAVSLGLQNTSFANPNGLDEENHYSTARDLARLTACAMRNATFARIVGTKQITVGERQFTNHNRLLWSDCGAVGVKTGYTRAAGRILVSAAEQKGRRLIAVTINDSCDWEDHRALYAYGFSQYEERVALHRGETAAVLPAMDGREARLCAAEDIRLCLSREEELRVEVQYPRVVFAPGEPGEPAGMALIYSGEKQLASLPLIWGEAEVAYGRTNS